MKPHVSKNRLNALADFLDTLPPKKFDFSKFASGTDLKNTTECKTVGCALGWACTMPRFRKAGLSLFKRSNSWDHIYVALKSGDSIKLDFDAGAELFGVGIDESMILFHPESVEFINGKKLISPGYQATSKQVAAHIRKFIKLKWPS